LHGAWTRGVSHLAGGEDELVDFLLERVRAHGGDTRVADRATALVHKGGKVRGVHIDGDEAPVGVTFVVSDLPGAAVLDLARDFAVPRNDKAPALEIGESRFVLSLVVRPEGVPRPLATESFLLPGGGKRAVVHLQKAPGAALNTVLLVAEVILPEGAPLTRAREEVLATIFEFLPFIEKHALVCDSPHDGRPLWDFRNATAGDPKVGPASWGLRAQNVDRARLRGFGGSVEPEPMIPRFRVTPPQLHGLAGEPIRTALGNVFVTGRSTLPALGQEGELLAAWGVARVITRTDRRKEKMLRERWSKVELS
jgi:phytoene dehydrogenase-like protein